MCKSGRVGSIVLVATLAALAGCGGSDKKPDDGDPAHAPKETAQPKPGPAEPEVKAPVGEPKFKLTAKEFIKEYKNNPPGTNVKYSGAVVELTGNVTRSAGVELDSFGKPAGKAGAYTATFAFGEWDANLAESVVVRGLKPAAVGQVLRGQEAKVKGRVAKHRPPHPVELLDAELLSPGAPTSISLNDANWRSDANREKLFDVSAKLVGTVEGKGTAGGEYLIVSGTNVARLRCYLMNGIGVLFPSGFPEGSAVTLAGTLRQETAEGASGAEEFVLRDCIPLHRDLKAK